MHFQAGCLEMEEILDNIFHPSGAIKYLSAINNS